jgi:outer membrane protein insertion porin family
MKISPQNSLLLYLFQAFLVLAAAPQADLMSQNVTKVTKLDFDGNSVFSDKELSNFMTSKEGTVFAESQFDLDLKNITKTYQSAGYLDCRIVDITRDLNFDSTGVALTLKIEEGKQTLIGEMRISGNKLFSTSYLKGLIESKPGSALDERTLDSDMKEILNQYEKKGYTFASVSVINIETYSDGSGSKLRVEIRIEENDRIKVDNIVVEGNTSTKREVIVREISLGEDNTITRDNLLDIRQRLENIGYFESVEQPKILKYKNSTVLYIKVREGNTNTFDGILGYVPPVQSEETGYFTGLVNLSLRNLFGTGRRLEARFKKEIKTTQELELKYLEPWLFGYPANVNFAFFQRIEDSSFIKRVLGTKIDAMISKKFTVSALLDFERVIPSLNENIYSVFDSRVFAAGVEIRFDNRDYVYNPFSGLLYRVSYTAGQKKIYNAGEFTNYDIPSDFTVQKGSMDFDFYYSFFKRQSSLIGLHGIEIRSQRLENSDLFRFGGINSVRGYRESQFLASRTAWSNIEFRYSLTRKSFAAAFYDMGYYLRPDDALSGIQKQEGFIYGYGLGIRIETALGMFGVSYALGKGDSILEGKIHFGLVNDF